jgi:hypothetical protein
LVTLIPLLFFSLNLYKIKQSNFTMQHYPNTNCYWPMIHRICVLLILGLCLFIATRWTVPNWSSSELVYGLLYKLMCKQTLSTLIRIEVIWSTEPKWNICIIQYFSCVMNSNKQHSNETLVGTVIRTSDLRNRRWGCYSNGHFSDNFEIRFSNGKRQPFCKKTIQKPDIPYFLS